MVAAGWKMPVRISSPWDAMPKVVPNKDGVYPIALPEPELLGEQLLENVEVAAT